MTFIPSLLGKIDNNNTTTTPLEKNKTFYGSFTNVAGYESVIVNVYSDKKSTENGLRIQFSTDNIEWQTFITLTIPALSFISKSYPVIANYYRIQYDNNILEDQAVFRLQTSLKLSGSVQLENCSIISICNSNLKTIAANTTWYGTWEDISQSAQIITNFKSSHNGEFSLQFSSVGNDTSIDKIYGAYVLRANIDCNQMFAPVRKYFRIVFNNTSPNLATVSIETRLLSSTSILYNNLEDTMDKNTSCMSNRSVTFGLNDNNTNYTQIKSNSQGNLKVAINEPLSVFGNILTEKIHPLCYIDYNNNYINPHVAIFNVAADASYSVNNNILTLNSGSAINSNVYLTTKKSATSKEGRGIVARISTIFSNGSSDTIQIAGLGDDKNGFFFGYNGINAGILYRNTTNAGLQNNWILQNNWNIDCMDGSNSINNKSGILLDLTKGNILQIKYQGFGFGLVKFYIETINGLVLVHVINFTNSIISTNITNRNLPLYCYAGNTKSDVNTILKIISGALYVDNSMPQLENRFGIDHTETNVSSTLTSILSIKCNTVFNSLINNSEIKLSNISISCANNSQEGLITLQIIKNCGLAGENYLDYNTSNSIASINTVKTTEITTTESNCATVFNTCIASGTNQYIDLSHLNLFLTPSEKFAFAVKSTHTTEVAIAFCWTENI